MQNIIQETENKPVKTSFKPLASITTHQHNKERTSYSNSDKSETKLVQSITFEMVVLQTLRQLSRSPKGISVPVDAHGLETPERYRESIYSPYLRRAAIAYRA
ncbi:hypothetical protein AGR6A_pTi0042 [Agrobacterium sp. NCPPB 925]|nr:hypothetical protein AGR6A_pTi0042 [Agrobacterium sp. NCPPB 925]